MEASEASAALAAQAVAALVWVEAWVALVVASAVAE